MLPYALAALRAGYSVVPIRRAPPKTPAVKWRPYADQRMTETEARRLFAGEVGMAVLGGQASEGLVILDFDERAAYDAFTLLAEEDGLFETLHSLPVVSTPSGGRHLYFRAPFRVGNRKLAMTREGLCRIETRGHGGYALCPPTDGRFHPDGKPYRFLRGGFLTVPSLNENAVRRLFALARRLDETPRRPVGFSSPALDDYDPLDALLRAGWQVETVRGEDCLYLTRPGKRQGVSAIYHPARKFLWNFSTNAYPLPPGKVGAKDIHRLLGDA